MVELVAGYSQLILVLEVPIQQLAFGLGWRQSRVNQHALGFVRGRAFLGSRQGAGIWILGIIDAIVLRVSHAGDELPFLLFELKMFWIE